MSSRDVFLGGAFEGVRCLAKKLIVYVKVPFHEKVRRHVLVVLVLACPFFEFSGSCVFTGVRGEGGVRFVQMCFRRAVCWVLASVVKASGLSCIDLFIRDRPVQALYAPGSSVRLQKVNQAADFLPVMRRTMSVRIIAPKIATMIV